MPFPLTYTHKGADALTPLALKFGRDANFGTEAELLAEHERLRRETAALQRRSTLELWGGAVLYFLQLPVLLLYGDDIAEYLGLDSLRRDAGGQEVAVAFLFVALAFLCWLGRYGQNKVLTKQFQADHLLPVTGTRQCLAAARLLDDSAAARAVRDEVVASGRQLYQLDIFRMWVARTAERALETEAQREARTAAEQARLVLVSQQVHLPTRPPAELRTVAHL